MPRTKPYSRWIALAGNMVLCYLAGAAVIFFGLPPAGFLERAFIGAGAWSQSISAPLPVPPEGSRVPGNPEPMTDEPSKTFDGFTLYSCVDHEGEGTEAMLIDMRGDLVHRWSVPKWQIELYLPTTTEEPHVVHNFKPGFFGLSLDSQGDLLVVSHGAMPVGGCGLLRLDKDSNIVWKYRHPVHHDVDVTDDGTIYAIQTELLFDLPPGLGHIVTPCHSDSLVLISPEGKPLIEPISIFDAIRRSPYALLLSSLGVKRDSHENLLHTNFVQVLRPGLVAKLPGVRPGQVLVSIRDLDMLAVIDIQDRSLVWAATGPWKAQHSPQLLENGNLLVFDNRGGPHGSRVLEYDPQTQAFPWSYPGFRNRPFYSRERGMGQRLPNGNTLTVSSEGGEILEVSRDQEVVWSYSTGRFITFARRYGADELKFLGDQRARP